MATPIPANHARFTTDEIVHATGGTLDGAKVVTTSVAIDSRAVTEGALFVAIRGESHDGHRFVDAAARAGASAVLARKDTDIGRPRLPVVRVDDTLVALGDLAAAHRLGWGRPLVAITGSAGKTTTKELTHAALEAATGARVAKTIGNLNNLVGVPMTLFTLDENVDLAVVEMGTSTRGEIGRLGDIGRPDVAVVTLVSAAHTEGLGDIEAVAEEKASLLHALHPAGAGVINGDDGTLARWSERAGISRRIFFGMAPHADVRLVSHELDSELRTVAVYDVCDGEARIGVRLALLGEAAARNGAAALAVVLARGDDLEAAARGIERVQPAPGRMCPRVGNGLRVLDDTYNANPRSMALALDTAREVARVTSSRLVAVLGDMKELGARSAGDHAAIGEHAVGSGAKAIVFVGPEMAHAADAARAKASPGTVIVHVATTEAAVDEATALVAPGDVVLVKGSRSMATERVVVALLGEEGGG